MTDKPVDLDRHPKRPPTRRGRLSLSKNLEILPDPTVIAAEMATYHVANVRRSSERAER